MGDKRLEEIERRMKDGNPSFGETTASAMELIKALKECQTENEGLNHELDVTRGVIEQRTKERCIKEAVKFAQSVDGPEGWVWQTLYDNMRKCKQ